MTTMKTVFALLMLFCVSSAFAQESPFGTDSIVTEKCTRMVMSQFSQNGSKEEIRAIEKQSDYGRTLSDSILNMRVRVALILEAISDVDEGRMKQYWPPAMGWVDDSIGIKSEAFGDGTREQCFRGMKYFEDCLRGLLNEWDGLLMVYRGKYDDPTVTVIVGSLK